MKYKMIVTDLDRTLLRGDGSISEYTVKILDRVRGNGIKLVFATARPIRNVKNVKARVCFDSCIYHNGAVVQFEKEIVFHKGIYNPINILQNMLHGNPYMKIGVESCDTLYANFDVNDIWPKTVYIHTKDFEECRNQITEKIIIPQKEIDEINIFEYMHENLYLEVSEKKLAMILNKEASKVNGVRLVAEMYGISMEDVVAFGDDYNDIEILKNCGLGVAVRNAYDDVKNYADDICESNENDGVAQYINEIILDK